MAFAITEEQREQLDKDMYEAALLMSNGLDLIKAPAMLDPKIAAACEYMHSIVIPLVIVTMRAFYATCPESGLNDGNPFDSAHLFADELKESRSRASKAMTNLFVGEYGDDDDEDW